MPSISLGWAPVRAQRPCELLPKRDFGSDMELVLFALVANW